MTREQIDKFSDSISEKGNIILNFGSIDFGDLEHVTERLFKSGDKVLFFLTENQNKKLKSEFEKYTSSQNITDFKKVENEIVDYCFLFNGVEFVCSIRVELKNSVIIHSSLEAEKSVLILETE